MNYLMCVCLLLQFQIVSVSQSMLKELSDCRENATNRRGMQLLAEIGEGGQSREDGGWEAEYLDISHTINKNRLLL